MSLNLAIWWMDSHSTIGSPLKHWTLGGCIWHGSCIGMLCLLFFAMVAMNLKDHEFGLKFSFRYQRFELWYDDPNCLRIIRISSGVSKRNKRGGSIMMQIYVNFEGFGVSCNLMIRSILIWAIIAILGVILPSEVTYLQKESKAEQINVQGCILQFGVNWCHIDPLIRFMCDLADQLL